VVVAGPADEESLALKPLELAAAMDNRVGESWMGRFSRPATYEPHPQALKSPQLRLVLGAFSQSSPQASSDGSSTPPRPIASAEADHLDMAS
jgi:hypothetical protein